jgi:hypothetical protein
MPYPELYYYGLLVLFSIVVYMIVVDRNVATYIILLTKIARLKVNRFVFWLRIYPRLRFDTFWLKRKSRKALEIRKTDSTN